MAQRQSNLFVAEDFRTIYRSFSEINFTAYDFDTIKEAMIEYLVRNFPEEFNDFIESSEFVAIIELLAYMGQTIAFRQDLNTRENFLDTAERDESILRLSKMLSYVPKRNIPAAGLLKFHSIRTTEDVFDSNGNNLASQTVLWNDVNNADYLEQFILILNSGLIAQNLYGSPVKQGSVGNVPTELYSINTVKNKSVVYPIQANVNGEGVPFEVVNSTFDDTLFFKEVEPGPANNFNIFYLNDGLGNDSSSTGFFAYVKQGRLTFDDFDIQVPLPNREISIAQTDINNLDVWVQTINTAGEVLDNWVRVPAVSGNNIVYNSVQKNTRKIFVVESDVDNSIVIRFADGEFGDVPYGILRVWYRQSINKSINVKAEHIGIQTIQFPYVDKNALTQTMTIALELTSSISNSAPSETNAEIKTNASQVFYTQDRMVTGEDYNIYPAFKNNSIVKIKAVNRTHAGHSRYIDINDPTGNIQNLNVFAEDGIIFKDEQNSQILLELTSAMTSNTVIMNSIQPQLSLDELTNFYYDIYRKEVQSVDGNAAWRLTTTEELQWVAMPDAKQANTGYFVLEGADVLLTNSITIGPIASGKYVYLIEKCLLEFKDSTGDIVRFATIENIINHGDPSGLVSGPIELNVEIPKGYTLYKFYPRFKRLLNTTEKVSMHTQLDLRNTFGIGFDYKTSSFYTIAPNNLDMVTTKFGLTNQKDTTSSNKDNSWIIKAEFQEATSTTDAGYSITTRGLRYIFESEEEVRFYFNNAFKTIDVKTGQAQKDVITLLKVNLDKRAQIERVNVLNPGSGYVVSPAISFGFAGEVDPAESIGYLSWNTITGGTGGNGYQPTTAGRTYLDSAVVDEDGNQTEIIIDNTAVLIANGRSMQARANLSDGAEATLNIQDDAVGEITITNAGSGYTAIPTITIDSPGGSGVTATATAILSTQLVSPVVPTNKGSGYQNFPELAIDPPGYSGTAWTVKHNLGQQYVNFEIIDNNNNAVVTTYDAPTIKYLDANTLKVVWPTVIGSVDGYVDVIKSQYVSPLQPSSNEWVINHGLTGTDGLVNVEVVYSNDEAVQGRSDYPLVEYTSETICKVRFPTGIATSGRVMVTNKFGNAGAVGSAYVHTEASAATTWTVNHNLGKKHLNVDIAILGTASNINTVDFSFTADPTLYYGIRGLFDQPVINYVNENQLTITFLAATDGKAVISGGDLFAPDQIQATGAVHMEVGSDPANVPGCPAVTINSGGNNFIATDVGKVYSLIGGTTTVGTLTIATVDTGTGECTGVTLATGGDYINALPTVIGCTTTTTTGSGTGLTVDLNFMVKEIEITNAGNGYQSIPALVLDAPTGTCADKVAAILVPTVVGLITAINIDDAGTEYDSLSPPSVVISPPASGTQATGVASIMSSVSTVTITNAGADYDPASPPTVTFPAPSAPPSGIIPIAATGDIIANDPAYISSAGQILQVRVLNGGIGYTSADNTVVISIAGSGKIISVDIIDTGFGYTGQPIITYGTSTGGTGATSMQPYGFLSHVEITEVGNGYTEDATVTFSAPTSVGGVTGTGSISLKANNKLDKDLKFNISDLLTYEDGYQDPRKALITFVDSDNDGTPDDPLSFDRFVDTSRYIFQETFTDFDGYVYYKLSKDVLQANNSDEETIIKANGVDYLGRYVYNIVTKVFSKIVALGTVPETYGFDALTNATDGDKKFSAFIGRSGFNTPFIKSGASPAVVDQDEEKIFFQWKHYAPVDQRIDPSITNLIDIFVLTLPYYNDVVSWKANNKTIAEFPEALTSAELSIALEDLNNFKSISDEIIYRPVKFKLLFGSTAVSELQSSFKAVKMLGSNLSDNELRSKIIEAVNEFFDITNWDMGESFYYTELAAYIHQKMPTHLSSIVVVPKQTESNFGNLFQVKAEPDELFLNTAKVVDVEVVKGYTEQNLKVK